MGERHYHSVTATEAPCQEKEGKEARRWANGVFASSLLGDDYFRGCSVHQVKMPTAAQSALNGCG